VLHGPPNALDDPNPASSTSTISTFGAPSGGRNGTIGGNTVSGSFASYVVSPAGITSGIGKISRFGAAWSGTASPRLAGSSRKLPARTPSCIARTG
jgi:hypothetical protein